MKWTMTTIPITKASFRKPYSSRWECKRVSTQGSMHVREGNKTAPTGQRNETNGYSG